MEFENNADSNNFVVPQKRSKAPLFGLLTLLLLAVGFFLFLSGNKVMEIGSEGKFTGDATVLDTKLKGQKCYLEIRRDDGVKEIRANGYKNNCGKYDTGQKVHYTKGLIDD